jgi:putative NADH-flavin reductase
MRILLLGATGRTGKLLLSQALARGHEVHVLVRDRHKVTTIHPNLQVMQGYPADRSCLVKIMEGCDAVISTLNISRYNDFPWTPLRTPKDFLSDTMTAVMSVASTHQLRRIIFTSAWGVGDSKADLPGWFRWLVKKSNLRYPYADLDKVEKLLEGSEFEWTAVRPVMLTNTKKTRIAHVVFAGKKPSSLFISRASVAAFMLDALEQGSYVGEKPVISR